MGRRSDNRARVSPKQMLDEIVGALSTDRILRALKARLGERQLSTVNRRWSPLRWHRQHPGLQQRDSRHRGHSGSDWCLCLCLEALEHILDRAGIQRDSMVGSPHWMGGQATLFFALSLGPVRRFVRRTALACRVCSWHRPCPDALSSPVACHRPYL